MRTGLEQKRLPGVTETLEWERSGQSDGGMGAHRPRILFASRTAESTGPTTSLGLLLNHLADEVFPEVLLLGRGPFGDTVAARGIPTWYSPSMGVSDLPKTYRLLKRRSYDLVYLNETSPFCRNVALAALMARIPVVSHVRSMGWRHGWSRLGHLRFAQAVIGVSQACADSVARFTGDERLHVVHNGIPAVNPSPPSTSPVTQRAEVRDELGIPEDCRLILNVSHLSPRKGQIHALRALVEVLSTESQVHLALVGALDRDPAYVERLREGIVEWGLDGSVSILGFRSDVGRLMEASDLLLHTALADPHPRAVLEAMAASIPVVGFAVDGVKETVIEDQTGHLVPPQDDSEMARAMIDLLRDQRRAAAMGRAGRDRVRARFTAARTAEEVGRILDGVLTSSRRPR